MSIWCNIFGHKWDTDIAYEQDCTRKACTAWRALYEKKYPKIGEAKYHWQIFDISKLKLK